MDVRSLNGKVAVVTGAASGIGRATALAMAERGADLAICDIDEAALGEAAGEVEARGSKALAVRVDVSDPDQVRELADRCYAEFARADIVVNNAGIGVGGPLVDIPLEEWNTIIGINLKGVVHGCHFFAPRMIEAARPGHIVNVASMAGYVPMPGMTAYSATKYGVVGISECLRGELAPYEIGVTAICPGMINTPIVRSSRMYGPDATEEVIEQGVAIFQRRNYGPEKVAAGILKAIQKNRAVAPVSPEAWVGYWVKRLTPGLLRVAANAMSRAGLRRQPG